MKKTYKSDTCLGDKYRDPLTGFEGYATAVTFYIHACERITLEFAKDGEIKYESFDAPRLIHVDTETRPTTTRTGGPGGRGRLDALIVEARETIDTLTDPAYRARIKKAADLFVAAEDARDLARSWAGLGLTGAAEACRDLASRLDVDAQCALRGDEPA